MADLPKPLILEFKNGNTMELHYDLFDRVFSGMICYNYDPKKLNHPIYGVNAVGNCLLRQYSFPQYSHFLELKNSILSIRVTKFY